MLLAKWIENFEAKMDEMSQQIMRSYARISV